MDTSIQSRAVCLPILVMLSLAAPNKANAEAMIQMAHVYEAVYQISKNAAAFDRETLACISNTIDRFERTHPNSDVTTITESLNSVSRAGADTFSTIERVRELNLKVNQWFNQDMVIVLESDPAFNEIKSVYDDARKNIDRLKDFRLATNRLSNSIYRASVSLKSAGVDPDALLDPIGGCLEKSKNELSVVAQMSDEAICYGAIHKNQWSTAKWSQPFVAEATNRELLCGVLSPQVADAEQAQQEIISEPTVTLQTQSGPSIKIMKASVKGAKGVLEGVVDDAVGISELKLDGSVVAISSSGSFSVNLYVPLGGRQVTLEAVNKDGIAHIETVALSRNTRIAEASIQFDPLDPVSTRVALQNKDAVALVVGISRYQAGIAEAEFADRDAQVFADYAALKLGVPQNRIKTLVNEDADFADLLLSIQDWLRRSVKSNKTDVYIFFAGHGLASDDGEQTYLIPHDGSPRLLSRTALSRKELFDEVKQTSPRSVTIFLDTCYSGDTRGGADRLVSARPLGIKVKEQMTPTNFTVFSAAAADQIAKPLSEVGHGVFSYFLMKGLEGGADLDGDKLITASELHQFIETNVIRQSDGSQVPELNGENDRVLVRFQ